MATTLLNFDEAQNLSQFQLIEKAYCKYHNYVLGYLRQRLNTTSDAEDLAQDVFIRLLEYAQELREDTLKYFVFSVTRNILYDYLRKHYRMKGRLIRDVQEHVAISNDIENGIIARDLQEMEQREITRLSPQRKTIYILYRFSEQNTSDIADVLSLSKRTVENHIFSARKTIREAMWQHCN